MDGHFFDGYPYQVTRVCPSLYHLLILPRELPFGHLKEIVRWQAGANKMASCLVLGPEECIYFEPDGSEALSSRVPCGGVQVAGFLCPCYRLPATEETIWRLARLERWVEAHGPQGNFTLRGCDENGTPEGLTRCPVCGDCRGECLDPSPQFARLVMRVYCLRERHPLRLAREAARRPQGQRQLLPRRHGVPRSRLHRLPAPVPESGGSGEGGSGTAGPPVPSVNFESASFESTQPGGGGRSQASTWTAAGPA